MFQHRTKFIVLAAAFLIGLVGFGLNQGGKVEIAEPDHVPKTQPVIRLDAKERVQNLKSPADLTESERKIAYEDSLMAALPGSLKDIPTPDSLDVDAAGDLVINTKIRKMFDHYLSALGEEDLPIIVDRIEILLERQLNEPARSQAVEILDSYIEFKGAMDGILQQSALFQSGQFDGQSIAILKHQIRLERTKYFSDDVISAFFAQDDQYDDYMLAKSKITNTESLSDEDIRNAISRLNQDSPTWLVEQDSKANKIDRYQSQERALRESGAQDWEIKDYRRRELGDEAAAQLELLDQRRADWDQRLLTYRAAVKDAMAQYDDQNAPDAISRRDQIRAEHFKTHELRRVISLDAIAPKE